MRQNTLNTTLAGMIALACAAGAAAYDERAISQSTQAMMVAGAAGGKLAFRASGAPTDLVVIRLADGSVFAAATLEQLAKGLTGTDHKIPEDPRPIEPAKSAEEDGKETQPGLGEEGEVLDDGAIAVSSGKTSEPTEIEVDDGTLSKEDDTAVSQKTLVEEKAMEAWFTFASIPWAFHGGSVSVYRGEALLDRDMILLH